MSRVQAALMNLAEAIQNPAVTSESLGAIEVAVRHLAAIRAATVPRAIFDGQLLAFAEELVPLLHDSRYLGAPELAPRWNGVIRVVSAWYEDTQGEGDES